MEETNPLDTDKPGRFYVGVCALGKGPHTPTARIWSRLLQETNDASLSEIENNHEIGYYWTLVGYFNAIKELAQVATLYRQDIPERLKIIAEGDNRRKLSITSYKELSSNIKSQELPEILDKLSKDSKKIDALMATSMFGTGVDIDRLSLMVVHGQPKTTSSYIQATGRVGRKKGALVVTFLRSTRPRDLAHYEFFTGYHRSLHRYVEPVTLSPFSPRAIEKALGPVCVAILRNGLKIFDKDINAAWAPESHIKKENGSSGSRFMKSNRNAPELIELINLFEYLGQRQPEGRRRPKEWVRRMMISGFDEWRRILHSQSIDHEEEKELVYSEQTYSRDPTHSVVLGDFIHKRKNLRQVYESVPLSLREIEPTTKFDA